MSRLDLKTQGKAQKVVGELYESLERRVAASHPGLCPVDMAGAFLRLCHGQSCGKCVPCRVGLGKLEEIIDDILDGDKDVTSYTMSVLKGTARAIYDSADCAIGYEAARMVLHTLDAFAEDYISHIEKGVCAKNIREYQESIPCVGGCPARVDIPGYVALVNAGKPTEAVELIKKDNPFPTACALVCEHPCELHCRRSMVDSPINIRGIKRYAVDNAKNIRVPKKAESTGKKIAIIGGGPSGLTAAYYLQIMGHQCTIFDKRKHLGGMLRYGIPSYRLPRERLQEDIDAVLDLGVEVHSKADIGNVDAIRELRNEYDAIYIAIGAHSFSKLRIEGEDARGVLSAVEMLRAVGDGEMMDLTGKNVCVVGGGNVAMDVARTSKRMGAKEVNIIYRRRREDMTAHNVEIEGAIADGCEVVTLKAPSRVEVDENGDVKGLWVQPQLIGLVDGSGRPKPGKADCPEELFECDIVIAAIGQKIESDPFEELGIATKRGTFSADERCIVSNVEGVYAGGDCVTGPATAILSIAAGKTAAANIDEYLGYAHEITVDVEIPVARPIDRPATGRVQLRERPTSEKHRDFLELEVGMTEEEALQESSRCLRCDHFGMGCFKGGREKTW